MHADAKHEEHDTEFSKLIGESEISDHTWGVWTDDNTGNKIAD